MPCTNRSSISKPKWANRPIDNKLCEPYYVDVLEYFTLTDDETLEKSPYVKIVYEAKKKKQPWSGRKRRNGNAQASVVRQHSMIGRIQNTPKSIFVVTSVGTTLDLYSDCDRIVELEVLDEGLVSYFLDET